MFLLTLAMIAAFFLIAVCLADHFDPPDDEGSN